MNIGVLAKTWVLFFLPSFLSFWGPVKLYLNSPESLVGGDKLLTNGGVQKQLCGCCQFINHTLLQVWHLALVWRVLWLKGLLWLRRVFHIQMERAPSFVSPSQLDASPGLNTDGAHWGGSGNRSGEPLYGAMRGMWAAQPGTRWPLRTIPWALQSQSSLCGLFLQGPILKVSKYSPADIVSQLFHLDNSGLDSNLEPLRLWGIQCIPDDNPWDSKPCLCAASLRALWKDGCELGLGSGFATS